MLRARCIWLRWAASIRRPPADNKTRKQLYLWQVAPPAAPWSADQGYLIRQLTAQLAEPQTLVYVWQLSSCLFRARQHRGTMTVWTMALTWSYRCSRLSSVDLQLVSIRANTCQTCYTAFFFFPLSFFFFYDVIIFAGSDWQKYHHSEVLWLHSWAVKYPL